MKRPWEVTFIGFLFILTGVAGLAYHLARGPLDRWMVLIAATSVIAIVGGKFLLQGRNWARWLVVVWLALHVVISAFNSASETLAHLVLLMVIGYFLWLSAAAKYFRPERAQ